MAYRYFYFPVADVDTVRMYAIVRDDVVRKQAQVLYAEKGTSGATEWRDCHPSRDGLANWDHKLFTYPDACQFVDTANGTMLPVARNE
jgi:hypothetical protein